MRSQRLRGMPASCQADREGREQDVERNHESELDPRQEQRIHGRLRDARGAPPPHIVRSVARRPQKTPRRGMTLAAFARRGGPANLRGIFRRNLPDAPSVAASRVAVPLCPAPRRRPRTPLTLQQVMADPDWIGAPVEDGLVGVGRPARALRSSSAMAPPSAIRGSSRSLAARPRRARRRRARRRSTRPTGLRRARVRAWPSCATAMCSCATCAAAR